MKISAKDSAIFDDIATAITVNVLLECRSHKMFRDSPSVSSENLSQYRERLLKQRDDSQVTLKQLCSSSGIVPDYMCNDSRFLKLLSLYVQVLRSDSGVQFKKCGRFPGEAACGVQISTTQKWPKNFKPPFCGVACHMTQEEEKDLIIRGENDFSIATSSVRNSNQLMLGPLAYVNHECSPNSLFTFVDWSKKVV